jgi:hypothetical protein
MAAGRQPTLLPHPPSVPPRRVRYVARYERDVDAQLERVSGQAAVIGAALKQQVLTGVKAGGSQFVLATGQMLTQVAASSGVDAAATVAAAVTAGAHVMAASAAASATPKLNTPLPALTADSAATGAGAGGSAGDTGTVVRHDLAVSGFPAHVA